MTRRHQATAYGIASNEQYLNARTPWLFTGSVLMVLFQCATAASILSGTLAPSCASNDMCSRGQYCWVMISGHGRCGFCGSLIRHFEYEAVRSSDTNFLQNGTKVARLCAASEYTTEYQWYNSAKSKIEEPFKEGEWNTARIFWCDACFHSGSAHIDTWTQFEMHTYNVQAMGVFDWTALWLAVTLVGLTVIGEMKDIRLCELSLEQSSSGKRALQPGLRTLGFLRRWVFLPLLMSTVPALVGTQGGDALSVSLNTVAILFLAEIDNGFYTFGLSEKLKSQVEREGRVKLTAACRDGLAVTKGVHIALVPITLAISVFLLGRFDVGGYSLFSGFPAIGVGALVEIVAKRDAYASTRLYIMALGKVLASCLFGVLVTMSLSIWAARL